MITIFLVGIFLFFISSIKYIIFGSGEDFNVILFNFIEFAVFNNNLKENINNKNNIFSNIIMWAFFGLSPHNTVDNTINYIWLNIKNNSTDRRLSNINSFNLTDNISNNSTNINNINYIVNWVDDHKFILTMITVSSIIFILFIIAWFLEIKKRLF